MELKCSRSPQWQSITITLVEKVQIIAVLLGSLFLVASISWLFWSALSPQAIWQRRDVLFQICYAMYGFMDLVCVGEFLRNGMKSNSLGCSCLSRMICKMKKPRLHCTRSDCP